MTSVLVLYASEEGQTRKIATRVAELLAGKDFDIHLRDASKANAATRLATFDGAIRHSRYSLARTVMVRLSLMRTGTPDAGDHEYTDWKAVETFADSFARRLATPSREGR